jgi:hypothetical protein
MKQLMHLVTVYLRVVPTFYGQASNIWLVDQLQIAFCVLAERQKIIVAVVMKP